MKKGITLIELLVALIIAVIALVAVISFLYASWKEWHISTEIKELQEDVDLAGFNIKAVLEEANYYEIRDIIEDSTPEQGQGIYVKYTDDDGMTVWEKEFYLENNKLVLEDVKNETTDTVIKTLQNIIFSDAVEENAELTNTVKVKIRVVSKSGKILDNEFSVKIRNR